jgi:hypothetical protein
VTACGHSVAPRSVGAIPAFYSHTADMARVTSQAFDVLLDRLGKEAYFPNPHRRALVVAKAELLPGTLDLLILKAVSLGALYPALYRLEHQGLLDTALRAQEA